ncbi:MAG TPA: ATP-binding protein [Devosia sp.]
MRGLSLSLRFLFAAVLVVALAMLGLGAWVGYYVQHGITDGVASTAASSIDALVAHQVGMLREDGVLTAEEKARLDEVFSIGNEADSARLLQIRIRDLAGRMLYQSAPLEDADGEEALYAAAVAGKVTSRLTQVSVPPVGPIAGLPIEVLEIYTPLHDVNTGRIFAVAEMYYSARTVTAERDRAQLEVWTLVGVSGLVVIAVLYLLVDRASRTIARQRERLAGNLAGSRRLAADNRRLRDASEDLRQSANFTNEALLAQVGSDIHDGPIQLLTLIILRLTEAAQQSPELAATAKLAGDVLEELRNISSGLVLPELAPLSLGQALELAISRHEALTGAAVARRFASLPEAAPLVVKVCGYRVVQEALTNAFRHGAGNGEEVLVELDEANRLRIRVTNNVRPGQMPRPHGTGLGLRGMHFRVESLGGTLHTCIGEGPVSTIEAAVPLGQPGQAPAPPAAARPV